MHPKEIHISDYSYDLPEERIAKYPLAKRDESKLLIYRQGTIGEHVFKDLPSQLEADNLLVYNNTKVIRARLLFQKATGGRIEIFCLEPEWPKDYALNFQQNERVVWRCMVGGAKKWKEGKLSIKLSDGLVVYAEKLGQDKGDFSIAFSWNKPDYNFSDILEKSGNIPIPPYLNRKSEASDLESYQTVAG